MLEKQRAEAGKGVSSDAKMKKFVNSHDYKKYMKEIKNAIKEVDTSKCRKSGSKRGFRKVVSRVSNDQRLNQELSKSLH